MMLYSCRLFDAPTKRMLDEEANSNHNNNQSINQPINSKRGNQTGWKRRTERRQGERVNNKILSIKMPLFCNRVKILQLLYVMECACAKKKREDNKQNTT
mmetsp:Transcript_3473/g.9947  ORF Transcript_3473/g.9947 Transcript_3473/m.9947 type:complete len:100 (+) Transcript_3473:1474-1773(+)